MPRDAPAEVYAAPRYSREPFRNLMFITGGLRRLFPNNTFRIDGLSSIVGINRSWLNRRTCSSLGHTYSICTPGRVQASNKMVLQRNVLFSTCRLQRRTRLRL